MFHRIWALGAAVVLMALPAGASLPDGSASSGAAVAAGAITSPTGLAMPGVAVDLYAWPSDAVLNAMKPGEFVPTTLLATATTNNAGEYMLRVPPAVEGGGSFFGLCEPGDLQRCRGLLVLPLPDWLASCATVSARDRQTHKQ